MSATPGPEPTGPPAPPAAPAPSTNGRTLASVAHLSALVGVIGIPSLLGPLIVLLTTRDDAYAQQQAREALNFNLSLLLYAAVALGVTIATLGVALLVVVPAVIVAAIAWFVLVIVAGVRASDGHGYRYPLTVRLVR